ncbi:MAG: 50S ribosomal protein L9 [Omnitrophica WOR_2 bacterium RIFCSPHIGHO2_02_FULL_67_20]|nr:MAG: 50S ribosomal protein L9 [Omnitrophica WOR_2 bacterium RIFCSPHIGHO2_02_FULL_67_20]
MDVILLKDVKTLGVEGAVVHVKPGFARNYLLPQGLAAVSTPDRLKSAETAKRRRLEQDRKAREEADALKRRLESRPLTFTLNVGDDGAPFGSVSVHDLADALAREGHPVEKRLIQLEQPLKTLGAFEVAVRLRPDVVATLKVLVMKA